MRSKSMLAIVVLALVLRADGGRTALAGEIVGWGRSTWGQTECPTGDDYVAIAAGGYHNLALKADGSIVGWGANFDGQATPPGGNDYVAIATGGWHSLALKSDGSIVAWGENDYGQATAPAGNDFVAISGGEGHSLALKSDGSIVGWGDNSYGQATAPAGSGYTAIASGCYHSLALKSDGSIVAWGISDGSLYDFGQVADTPAGNDYVAIATGCYHSLALKADGSIVAWGDDDWGQATPPAGMDFVAIGGGYCHSLAMKADGAIVAWGVSDGGTFDYGQVTDAPDDKDFVAVGAGGDHNIAMKARRVDVGAAFTYQGRLVDANSPGDGLYDLKFKLCDEAGIQQGTPIELRDLNVIDGYFTVELDFGSEVFNGDARWLEIGVRPAKMDDPNLYTILMPRTEIKPTPYALQTCGIFVDDAGNVGIGTTSPDRKLSVEGSIRSTISSACEAAVYAKNSHSGGGFCPWPAVGTSGGWFETIEGTGLYGFASASSGVNYGVYGKTNSTEGYAGYFEGGRNYFEGNVGIGTTAPAQALHVNGNVRIDSQVYIPNMGGSGLAGIDVRWDSSDGRLYRYSSSSRYKENIRPFRDDFHKILEANPKSFTCKTTGQRGIGFIAEEFDDLGLCDLVSYDQEGRPDAINYELISLYLLGVIHDEVQTTRGQVEVIRRLEQQNRLLEERVEALEGMMSQQGLALIEEVQQ